MAELEGQVSTDVTGVEIDWLDYGYVEKCTDATKLRKILDLLRSGKEGFYPDLEKFTEDRLLSQLPDAEKNRILRMKQKPSSTEISDAELELEEWQKSIRRADTKLRQEETAANAALFSNSGRKLPPVRGSAAADGGVAPTTSKSIPVTSTAPQKQGSKRETESNEKSKEKSRLSGYDFRAWEKFDADAAAERVDNDDLQKQNEVSKATEQLRESVMQSKKEMDRRRNAAHLQELENIRQQMNSAEMSDLQIQLKSGREKQKGNEHFRAGDFQAAYDCYTRSLALDPTNPAVYANRAIVGLRLEKLDVTEDDCTRALEIDPEYLKAWTRRGMARFKKGKYAEAASDFKAALKRDPGNAELNKLYANARNKYQDVEGKQLPEDSLHESVQGADMVISQDIVITPKAASSKSMLRQFAGSRFGELLREGKCDVARPEVAAVAESFTRVPIVMDNESDSESDNDAHGDNNSNEHAAPTESFSRIAITEEDESDSDAEETAVVANEGFTRITIAEDDSSEEEEENDGNSEIKHAELAVAAKEAGNSCMGKADHKGAVDAYTECLAHVAANNIADNTTLAAAGLPIAAWNNRAMAFLALKDFTNASKDCSEVLNVEPNNMKALYRIALCYKEMGLLESSQSNVEKLLKLDPKNSAALSLQDDIRKLLRTQEPKKSSKETEHPSFAWEADQVKRKAMSYLEQGDHTKAISLLEGTLVKFKAESPDAKRPLLLLLSNTLMALERWEEAIKVLDEFLSIDTSNFKAYLRRARAKFNLNNFDDAKKDALLALRIDSTDTEAMGLLDSIEQARNPIIAEAAAVEPPTAAAAVVPEKNSNSGKPENAVGDNSIKSNELKEAGNASMKQEQFSQAVALYTQSITLDPNNLLSYSNRSQAYLKLSKFADAERDATFVIESASRSSSANSASTLALVSKALYRRATARRNMGGSNIVSALTDFDALLSTDPSNAVFKKEREKVAIMAKEWEKSVAKAVAPSTKPPAASSSSSSSVSPPVPPPSSSSSSKSLAKQSDVTGMTAVATKKKSVVVDETKNTASKEPESVPIQSTTPSKQVSGSTEEASTPQSPKTSKVSPSPKKSPISRTPEVPTEPPKTLYELERIWRGLKDYPELFAKYLSLFKKTTFKKVINESVSHDLISSLLRALRDHGSSKVIATTLEGWSLSSGFSMTLQLLPQEDVSCLQAIFVKLSLDSDFAKNFEKLGLLKTLYNIE